jgi:enoyl-CoA hydratase
VPVESALAWGLVNRVVPPGEARATALAMARTLAAKPAVGLAACKAAIDMAFDRPEEEAVQASLGLSQRAFESADCREGVRAFFAKEPPRFTHR